MTIEHRDDRVPKERVGMTEDKIDFRDDGGRESSGKIMDEKESSMEDRG